MLPYHRVDVLYVNWSGTEISCSLGLRGRSKSRGLWDRGEVNRVLLEEIEGWGWQSLEIIRLLMLLMFKILHEPQRNATAPSMMQYGISTNGGKILANGVGCPFWGQEAKLLDVQLLQTSLQFSSKTRNVSWIAGLQAEVWEWKSWLQGVSCFFCQSMTFGLPKVIRPEMEQAQEEALPPEDLRRPIAAQPLAWHTWYYCCTSFHRWPEAHSICPSFCPCPSLWLKKIPRSNHFCKPLWRHRVNLELWKPGNFHSMPLRWAFPPTLPVWSVRKAGIFGATVDAVILLVGRCWKSFFLICTHHCAQKQMVRWEQLTVFFWKIRYRIPNWFKLHDYQIVKWQAGSFVLMPVASGMDCYPFRVLSLSCFSWGLMISMIPWWHWSHHASHQRFSDLG